MRRVLPTGCLLLLAVLAAGGCGGGSAEEFREQAGAICGEYDDRIREVPRPTNNAALVESANEIADLIEEGTARLAELDAPGDLEDDYDEWLALNEEAAANAREISAAAGRDEQARIRELAALAEENENDADQLAAELGLDGCVTGEELAS